MSPASAGCGCPRGPVCGYGANDRYWRDSEASDCARHVRFLRYTGPVRHAFETSKMTRSGPSSRPPMLAERPASDPRLDALSAGETPCGTATLPLVASSVGLGEVVRDGLRVRVTDRRAVDLNHFRDLGLPERFAAIRRLRVDVVNRVARQAVVLCRLHAGPWSQGGGLFGNGVGQVLGVTHARYCQQGRRQSGVREKGPHAHVRVLLSARLHAHRLDDVAHVAGGVPQRRHRLRLADAVDRAHLQLMLACWEPHYSLPFPDQASPLARFGLHRSTAEHP